MGIPEEELEKALTHFRNYLRNHEFNLSEDAALILRKYLMEKERKERILSELSKREKTSEDLIKGFDKLAATAEVIAISEGRRNIISQDVHRAIKRIFCKVWPFCK